VALIVENGTIVANANTYADVTVAAAFFSDRGLIAPVGGFDPLLLKTMSAFSGLYFVGVKTDPASALDFPRTGVANKDGIPYSEYFIPPELIEAQLWLAYYESRGSSLGAVATATVKKEKVGPLDVEYFPPKQDGLGNTTKVELKDLPNVYNLLKHLIDLRRTYGLGNNSGRVHRA